MARTPTIVLAVLLLFARPAPLQADDSLVVPDGVQTLKDLLDWAADELRTEGGPSPAILYKSEVETVRPMGVVGRRTSRLELPDFLRDILRFNGFCMYTVAEGTGRFHHEVIRDNQGRWVAWPTITREELEETPDARIVQCVLQLEHADAKEVQGALKLARISHPNVGNIVGIQSSNAVLIADYADLVRSIIAAAEELDRPAYVTREIRVEAYVLRDANPVPTGPLQGDEARAALAKAAAAGEAVLLRGEARSIIAGEGIPLGSFGVGSRGLGMHYVPSLTGGRLRVHTLIEDEGSPAARVEGELPLDPAGSGCLAATWTVTGESSTTLFVFVEYPTR